MVENVLPEAFRGLKDFRNASVFGGLASGVAMAAASATLLLLDVAVDLSTLAWVTLATVMVPVTAASLLMAARMRGLPRPTRRARLGLDLVSPMLWAGTAISFVITQMDLWVVGALRSQTDVALYGAAFRLSTLVMVPAAIANFVAPPLIVQLHERGETRRLQRLLQSIAGVASVPAMALVAVFVVAGGAVSQAVYGTFYGEAGALVAILAAGKLGNIVTGACGMTLIMTGGARENLVVMATNAAATVALQVLLVHRYGLAGLAAATAIGLVLQNLALLVAARRRAGVWTFANPWLALGTRLPSELLRRRC